LSISKKNNGFTLFEILISISVSVILLLIITGIFRITTGVKKSNSKKYLEISEFSGFYNEVYLALKSIKTDTDAVCEFSADAIKICYETENGAEYLNIKLERNDKVWEIKKISPITEKVEDSGKVYIPNKEKNAYDINASNYQTVICRIYTEKLKFQFLLEGEWADRIETSGKIKTPESARLISGENGTEAVWNIL